MWHDIVHSGNDSAAKESNELLHVMEILRKLVDGTREYVEWEMRNVTMRKKEHKYDDLIWRVGQMRLDEMDRMRVFW